ncbi:hypothetical protein [Magnetofaba australis]|uniref:CRISPR system ring nuclease SSO1393-like domain-containing protein n=1 Tax=Magnetofaba australis IT-1 TaxID=1434232 RepID=A0A1Y2K7Y6_9PROT|nr:hypothetical protein [Magnetofaba australis]OSM06173.1 hypothetical protein MAIT1_01145 [Magnetofaba australis IT-1]
MEQDHQVILTACGRELVRRRFQQVDMTCGWMGQACDIRMSDDQATVLQPELDALREEMLAASAEELALLCPELKSWIQIYEGLPEERYDRHVLLFSEAWPDAEAAKLLAEWLKSRGMGAQMMPIRGLREGDIHSFDQAMSHFTRWCGETLSNYKIYEFHILFNPVGGSRILVGLLQTLAPFYADESVYLLEPGEQLARLPMPSVQARGEKALRKCLHCIRRLAGGLEVHPEKRASVPEPMLLIDTENQTAQLSFFGELMWDHNRRDIYGEDLLEPISDRIILSEDFRDGAADLGRDRTILLNERLDQFAILIEQGEESMDATLKSLISFQQLSAPVGESTHRCHGWADKQVWKLLGHFEGKRYVMDALVSE